MAGNPMSAEIKKVFDDPDDYLRSRKEFGWAYNEADPPSRRCAQNMLNINALKQEHVFKIWMRDAKSSRADRKRPKRTLC